MYYSNPIILMKMARFIFVEPMEVFTITYPPKYNLGRKNFLVPARWTEDGWLELGDNGVVEEKVVVDNLEEKPLKINKEMTLVPKVDQPYAFYDDFTSPKLNLRWTYLYNLDDRYIKWDGLTGLHLQGMATNLSSADVSTFLGFRQEHHECTVCLKMIFTPQIEGEEAGIAVYMNRNHHYEAALTCIQGKSVIILRRKIGSLWKIEAKIPYEKAEVYFRLKATKEVYAFGYSEDGQDFKVLGVGETQYLTTEVGGAFTGNFIALYATGNGKVCEDIAKVAWVSYQAQS